MVKNNLLRLNKNKNNESLKYFILITIMPILGIIVMFSYTYFHLQDEVNFVSNEIKGLTCIENKNKKCIEDIKIFKERVEKSKQLSIYIVLAGLASIFFIIYINMAYYKNKKFIDKIEELTITDAMTSLYNRRYFDETFDISLKIQQRTKQTLVFIIMDIDFFKKYNDTYGHQAGDAAIKIVAKNLKNSLNRANDMAFRLGGEEFGVLCTGLDAFQAFDFANSIRKKIENEKVEHKKNNASKYLTVSMGLIVVGPSNINDIYKCADKALYKAKENGRNQVVIYNENI